MKLKYLLMSFLLVKSLMAASDDVDMAAATGGEAIPAANVALDKPIFDEETTLPFFRKKGGEVVVKITIEPSGGGNVVEIDLGAIEVLSIPNTLNEIYQRKPEVSEMVEAIIADDCYIKISESIQRVGHKGTKVIGFFGAYGREIKIA